MKISDLKPLPTTKVELLKANEPTGIFVTLTSRDSAEVKAVVQKASEKRLAAMRKGSNKPFAMADIEQDALNVLRAAIVGIEDTTEDPMEFTPETVEELLAIDWVRRQLDEAMGNEALFF